MARKIEGMITLVQMEYVTKRRGRIGRRRKRKRKRGEKRKVRGRKRYKLVIRKVR